jgi:hypothetical protein
LGTPISGNSRIGSATTFLLQTASITAQNTFKIYFIG